MTVIDFPPHQLGAGMTHSAISSEFAVEMWNVPSVLSVRLLAQFAGHYWHPDSPAAPLQHFSVKKAVFLCAYLPSTIMFVMSFILCNCTNTSTQLPFDFDWPPPSLCSQPPPPPPPPRVQQSCPAFRFSAARAVLRGLPHRPAVSRKWCHNDRERKLRPNGWQNLRRRPFPDGEHQLLSPRCLQDHVTKVKRH